jgi:hypothetical protein
VVDEFEGQHGDNLPKVPHCAANTALHHIL